MALIKVFASTATTFTDNGLGGIVPITCQVYEELNGQLELSLTHPIDDGGKWAKLEKFNIIYAPTHRGWQPFRIYSVDKSIQPGSVVIAARHIFYDLLGNFIEDSRPENMTGDEAGDKLLTDCQYAHNFTFSSDIAATNTAYYTRTNPVQALIGNVNNSFVNRWGGELVRDGYTIAMNSRIGADNGVTIKYRKNLSWLRIRESTKAVATRIYPIATGAGNTIFVLPEKYIDSAKIGDYPAPLVMLVKFTDIRAGSDEFPTSTEIYAEMRTRVAALYAKGVDTPDYAFDVSMVDLAQTEEHKGLAGATIALGDDVTVEHEPLGVDMQLRVVAVTYNCKTGRYDKLVIGTTAPSLSNHVATIDNDIAILKNAVSGRWFDEIAKNIIPCYDSQVSASVDSYNVAITQQGVIAKGSGDGKRNVAIGPFVEVSGDDNVAIGHEAKTAGGGENVAVGVGAGNDNANRWDCVYIGPYAAGGAANDVSVSIGYSAHSNGYGNIVMGPNSASGDNDYVVLIGSRALADGDNAVSLGKDARSALRAIAIGLASSASGQNGIAIGQGAAAGLHHIAMGYLASAEHASGYSMAMGHQAKANGNSDIAIGYEAETGSADNAGEQYSNLAIGDGAHAGTKNATDGWYYLNTAVGPSAAINEGAKNTVIGRMATVNGGDNNNVMGGHGWVEGDDNILIPLGASQTYVKGNKNIVIGNAYYYDGYAGAANEDKRILIGWVDSGGIPLMTGHSDDGLTFNSQDAAKTPLRVKAKTGQTADLLQVQNESDASIGGFAADGGSHKLVDQADSISKKVWVGAELPATPDAGTVYVKQLDDTDIWGAM